MAVAVARFRRKDLKRDRFVEEVTEGVGFVARHRNKFVAGGLSAVVAVVGGVGYWTYARQRGIDSTAALLKATALYGGVVSEEDFPGVPTFRTASERVDKVTRALDQVSLDFPGSAAAAGAAYYSGLLDRDEGNLIEARSHFEQAMRGKGREYPALARLALGQMLLDEGDAEAARQHFQAVAESPTRTVSRERAEIEVARTWMSSDPARAREILTAIRERNAAAGPLVAELLDVLEEGG